MAPGVKDHILRSYTQQISDLPEAVQPLVSQI